MKPTKVLSFVTGLVVMMLPLTSARGQVSFPGPELLGRPTDQSVTVNVVASVAIEAYFEYGTQSGSYPYQTTTVSSAANQPLVVVLSNLQSNTRYYYRMVYRQTGATSWITRAEHSFYTQRPPGSTFTFTVTADSHINIVFGNASLFQKTLQNIAGESPDFHLDLGDTFAMDSVTTQAGANSSYLNMRSYFGLISPSVPIFLALGNHEQEEGWHLGDTGGNLATSPPVMSTNARNMYYLNPDPLDPTLSSFYTGNTDTPTSAINGGHHVIEDYYAWQWGDALFVVIDPYWYTTTKPYIGDIGGGETSTPGSGDRWDWTLGPVQYDWLEQTLQNSKAKYKFIFAHQVSGGIDDYGRGGANAVPFVEWGGENTDGTPGDFGGHRPASLGWGSDPVHELLAANHVTAFFHAHDHEFAYEKRDGVVYQLVPMAADATYGYGFQQYHVDAADPYTISVLPNSGHLRVTVSPAQVTVDYVRAFLPGAGTNGQVAYTYNIPAPVAPGEIVVSSLSLNPANVVGGSANSTATVTLNGPVPAGGALLNLSSSNAAATVPASVTVAEGATSMTFPVASESVSSSTTSTITATYNNSSANATLTVSPLTVSSVSLNPTTVLGGAGNSTGTVTLNSPAPSGGVSVSLSSSNPSAATVQSSVPVGTALTSATFPITSQAVSSSATSVITAALNGSAQATLTVNPVATGLTSLTLNPTTVVGGAATSIGTVTLNGLAPPNGTVVTLSSSTPSAATVQTSVTVPANASSAAFTINSLSVTSSTTVTITATFNGSLTATLTVNSAPSFNPVRINAGGPAYTDSLGQRWTADTGFTGGGPYSVSKAITNTLDPTLYQTSRYGASFSYAIRAPAGTYTVTLKFAELYWTAAKGRVFNVAINGTKVLSNFDIFAAAGAAFKAVDETFAVTSSGTITIQFTTGSAGNPLVNAIQVVASAP
ncbi:MAG: malectin domain-containing carbohydrate-binding protein [Candidatus Acidiferrales bacterium]